MLINSWNISDPDGKIYVRRDDRSHALEFKISQVDPEFLKKVFQLEEKPDFLISEENGQVFKIEEKSEFKPEMFYTISSRDIEQRMSLPNDRGMYIIYVVRDFESEAKTRRNF